MSPLEAMLLGADRRAVSLPVPEAQIATLQEAYARYSSPCPFKPGDFVTPREGMGYTDAGLPHIVLEVADTPRYPFDVTDRMTPASSFYGMKLDIRVACFLSSSGNVDAFWQESWRLQAYEAKP